MKFIDNIKDKTILVVPSNIKNDVLTYINQLDRLVPIKIYSLEEIKKNVYFDYDEDAILYLMNKYGYVYEVSKKYIDNLYYIEDKNYSEEKLGFLKSIKEELDRDHLLKYNKLFIKSNKNTPFIVFSYNYLDSFDKKVLSNFNYRVIEKESINNSINVYKFNTMEDEILFVINNIVSLLEKGIDINKIYLTNIDSNYNSEIIRLFKLFNIPVDINTSSSIMSTTLGSNVFKYLEESKDLQSTLDYMNTFDLSNSYNQSIYKSILNIFNTYNCYDYPVDVVISAIKYAFLNRSIDNNNLSNMVRIGDISSFYDEDSYVFLLGFNQGSIPKIYKDEDYINDKLKTIVGLDSVNVINKLERLAFINNVKAIKNIIITYKEHYLEDTYYPSNLINEDIFNLVEDSSIDTSYSYNYSNYVLASMLDDLIKYDKKSSDLDKYYSSIDTKYMTYDNKFTGINKNAFYKHIHNKLTLSYTSLNSYYNCAFKYYLSHILKIDKYEENFATFIGSLFHDVLSHVYEDNFDMDKYYDNYLKDKEFSAKEEFYLNKLRKELKIICNRILEFYNDSDLKEYFNEQPINVDKSSDINVIFTGIVDKILYEEINNHTYVSIIDYKTGDTEININNAPHGIGMQLLIYLYLISKSNLFKDYTCVGFYLQIILHNEVKIEENKSYEDLKNNELKLTGYTLDDIDAVSKFDSTYVNSKYIGGLKVNKDGTFGANKHILTKDIMDSLINLVDRKINEARDDILACKFDINPKWIEKDEQVTGCKYCKYQDICNRKNEDIITLKKYDDLSFLEEGDNNE